MSAAASPLRALREVADQLSIDPREARVMVIKGELPAIVFTGVDALIAETALAEFLEARRYQPGEDR